MKGFIVNTFIDIFTEHLKYKKQILNLAKKDIIKTYKNTALGWPWAIIKPGITITVYYFAFTVGLRIGTSYNNFPYFLWLLAGIVPWFFIRDNFINGAYSIKKYRYLVTKIRFPISIIPTFVTFADLLVNLLLLVVTMLIFVIMGYTPDMYWIQLPLYILLMFMLATSWSIFSSMLSTMSNDFFQLIKSSTMVLFWTSGIMYDINNVADETIRSILLLNPITIIVNGFRDSLIYKEWFWQNWNEIGSFLIVYFIVTCIGLYVYKKTYHEIADIL